MPRSKKPTKSATDSSKLNNSADKWAEETIIVNGMPQVILFPEEE